MATVVIYVGSKSDVAAFRPALDVLDRFGVSYEPHIVSAHRAPERLRALVRDADGTGTRVYIAAAGLAAALPGAVAALTHRPVIGLPLAAGALNGIDSLLSIAQMPPGVPVATVGINAAANAAYLAVQILATTDAELATRFASWREEQSSRVDRFE
ncbi:MAG TPA: 5-(carboxyamino)imidazole ribonucleotide mutase [Chloroflexota bacterium]|jgi:5-(carboxyamino)imidazole ribonucleotide mutase